MFWLCRAFFCSFSLRRTYVDGKLCFKHCFLASDPAGDLQSALIHTALSVDNIPAKLLITAVQSPKGFKWCIKWCSSICHMWFLLLGMFACGEIFVLLCALEGMGGGVYAWGRGKGMLPVFVGTMLWKDIWFQSCSIAPAKPLKMQTDAKNPRKRLEHYPGKEPDYSALAAEVFNGQGG